MLELLAATPALPLDDAGKYVAGAYIVFMVLLVVYLGIMAVKVQRIESDLRELATFAEQRPDAPRHEAGSTDNLVPDDGKAAPGRGSEEPSISDSLAPRGSGGGSV